jgi:hypothetical protein
MKAGTRRKILIRKKIGGGGNAREYSKFGLNFKIKL